MAGVKMKTVIHAAESIRCVEPHAFHEYRASLDHAAAPGGDKRQLLGPAASKRSSTMTAFCLDKSGSHVARLKTDVPRPEPREGEALIRVLRAGICGTDLAMINNYKPGFEGAIGHEFVGIVESIGPSAQGIDQWVGKRVVGEINIPCGDYDKCDVCRRRLSSPCARSSIMQRNHCPHREALGILGRSGAFAEYITLPCANLLEVPDSVVNEEAVFTEPLAAAYRILEQKIIHSTDSVGVLGDGRLGLLVAEVLAVEKVAHHVTLIGKHTDKLALVADVVDSTRVYHSDTPLSQEFDVVVECTGSSTGISMALSTVRRGGRVIMKSTCAQPRSEISRDVLAAAALRSVAIIGSRCGPFETALRALEAKRVDVTKYIAAVFPLAQAAEALALARQRGKLKIQLDFTQ